MGLRSKMSNDLSRFSRIQSGSPFTRESSSITSRDTPFLAISWPCSFSLIELGFRTRVLSGVAMCVWAQFRVRDSDIRLARLELTERAGGPDRPGAGAGNRGLAGGGRERAGE